MAHAAPASQPAICRGQLVTRLRRPPATAARARAPLRIDAIEAIRPPVTCSARAPPPRPRPRRHDPSPTGRRPSRWECDEAAVPAPSVSRRRGVPPSKRPALPDPLVGGGIPTNLAKDGLTLSDS